jgi:predicted ferric reductase
VPPADRIPRDQRPPAEQATRVRHALVLLFAAGLAVSVSCRLLYTRPGTEVVDLPSLLVSAARVAGLAGGYLLFVQLLLVSRVAWLERSIGTGDLLRWHRRLGVALLAAVVAHVALILAGYAGTAHTGPLRLVGFMAVGSFPYVASAMVATAVLATIGIGAARQVRHRLPYELWHATHAAGYLVLFLTYGHQLALGADLERGYAHAYWQVLYAVVIAATLWGRVVEPVQLNLRHRCRVVAVVPENLRTISIYVSGRHLDRLPAASGQFMRWRLLTRSGWWQAHPFSLSAPPNRRWLRLTVTVSGRYTADLASVRPGTRVLIEGPYGALTPAAWSGRPPLLIAAGVGITTMRALLDEFGTEDAVLLYRVRDRGDAVFRTELDELARRHGVRVHYLEGGRPRHGSWLPAGHHPRTLQWLVPDVEGREAYVCGPPPWMAAVRADLHAAGVPDHLIHSEEFAW